MKLIPSSLLIKVLLLFLLYTGTNTLFVKSLEFIPNTKAATVLALDPLFCFILSFICLAAVCDSKNNLKNGIQFISAFLSILGVALVCLGANKDDVINDGGVNITMTNKTVEETDILAEYIGFGYAGMATLGASLYKTFCAKYIEKPCVRQGSKDQTRSALEIADRFRRFVDPLRQTDCTYLNTYWFYCTGYYISSIPTYGKTFLLFPTLTLYPRVAKPLAAHHWSRQNHKLFRIKRMNSKNSLGKN